MQIISNDPIVRQCLQSIAQTVLENGGDIHPALTINHQAERLWLSCPAEFRGETLLRIPDALFIPVSKLTWSAADGVLTYAGDTSAHTAAHKRILDEMVALYNTTDKINKVATRFPDSLFRTDPDLHALILQARPHIKLSAKSLAEQFISTRLSSQINEDSEGTTDHLMPLIDMLNHHPYGPKYGRNAAMDWVIPVQHPVAGSDECFVRYQKGDSLANAIWHGYLETAPRYLSSVQCSFAHDLLGTVTVHGVNYERRKLNAPSVQRVEGGMDLYSIILDPDTLPALRIFLGLAVRSVDRQLSQSQAELAADGLIDAIAAENTAYFLALQAFCAAPQPDFPLRPLFAQIAQHQLELLAGLDGSRQQPPSNQR
jgi:hypothetical protein